MDHLLDLNGRCCTRLYQLRTKSFVRERISLPYTDTRMTYTHRGVGCNASATTAAATPVVDLNDDYRRDREPPDPSLTLTSEVLGRPVHADSRLVELDPRLLVIDPGANPLRRPWSWLRETPPELGVNAARSVQGRVTEILGQKDPVPPGRHGWHDRRVHLESRRELCGRTATARSRKPHAKPTHVQRIALVSVLFHVQYASW
jgi:hypothetical protein